MISAVISPEALTFDRFDSVHVAEWRKSVIFPADGIVFINMATETNLCTFSQKETSICICMHYFPTSRVVNMSGDSHGSLRLRKRLGKNSELTTVMTFGKFPSNPTDLNLRTRAVYNLFECWVLWKTMMMCAGIFRQHQRITKKLHQRAWRARVCLSVCWGWGISVTWQSRGVEK